MAWHAGFSCRREWKSRLTSRDYEEILALAQRQVLGPERRDLGIAIIGQVIASCFGYKGGIRELLPVPPPEKPQTIEESFKAFQQYATAHNSKYGDDNRNPGSEASP
jgi:hypothetical protein